jgi:hypothetical protein
MRLHRRLNLLFFGVVFYSHSLFAQVSGCTDPLALNYNQLATLNDGSCNYQNVSITPVYAIGITDTLDETSGLIWWDNSLWSHNDNSDLNLYSFDTLSGNLIQNVLMQGTQNIDWEDVAIDSSYIYIGDFGNNANGNRTDLKIYRISKFSIQINNPLIDTISFTYSDQVNYNPTGSNNSDFDCEAMIVKGDSIHLFTKQWISKKTSWYSLPRFPGVHIAQLRGTLDVQGLVTGAVSLPWAQLVALSGYSQTLNPFIYLLYDHPSNDFFAGNKRKVGLSIPFHQVEGITTPDGLRYYITNEHFQQLPLFNTEQKLHVLDLYSLLAPYLGSIVSAAEEYNDSSWINVYPNPAAGKIFIRTSDNLVPGVYRIYDDTGNEFLKGVLGAGLNQVDISALAPGVYVIRSSAWYERFVIIR